MKRNKNVIEIDVDEKDLEQSARSDLSEDQLAQHFTKQNQYFRWVQLWGKWLSWNGKTWKEDHILTAYDQARKLCRELADKKEVKDNDRRRLGEARTIAAIERIARSDKRHAATVEQWDTNQWLLNTQDGILDLHTGELCEHDPNHYMTKITATGLGNECPLWHEFLDCITGDDDELQNYLQQVAGYCLTGSIQEHVFFFLWGAGANGKTVFVNTLKNVLGDYAINSPIETFIISHTDRHPAELAMLRGARLVIAVETEDGQRWAESRIKALTGGDSITARFMRQDFFTFSPQFKLILVGNHRPGLRNVDVAMRRRLQLVPFSVTIHPEKQDKELIDTLRDEWPGILSWLLEGCLAWQRNNGLIMSESVKSATGEYFETEDALGNWLDECCIVEPNKMATPTELFNSWRKWCEEQGEYVGSSKRFYQQLQSRGFQKTRLHNRVYRGIDLKPENASY